jgi:ring-1,2-phenylacetyl-CoA epoxidase subunit PaaD
MVSATQSRTEGGIVSLRAAVAAVEDPELRVVTIEDLGILRGVEVDGDCAHVTISPTYSGCPAMDVIRAEIRRAARESGYDRVEIVTELAPAWTTDWITEAGRAKLAAAGIAPPSAPDAPPSVDPEVRDATRRRDGTLVHDRRGSRGVGVAVTIGRRSSADGVACPRCGAAETERLSAFGATACLALWRCRACGEPFDHVKPF